MLFNIATYYEGRINVVEKYGGGNVVLNVPSRAARDKVYKLEYSQPSAFP